MALTPEDVVNKRFQPTKFREGYDQDEVDDFLDEIVVELRRLNQENDELRRKLGDGSADAAPSTSKATTVPAPVAASSSTQKIGTEKTGTEKIATEKTGTEKTGTGTPDAGKTSAGKSSAGNNAPEQAAPTTDPATVAPVSPSPSASAESAAGVLAMAQRLHDEYVNAGVEQRDKIIAEAQIEANTLVDDAQEKSRKTLGDLEEQKSVLERTVEQLRGFERDYRARLRTYIEGQLRDLDSHGSIASETSAS